jgi:hypothetical protein
MNEQLIRIAVEADAWCDQHHPDDECYNLKWEEKFAELIVRECAQIAMQQQQSHSFDSYDELTEYERGQDDTASTISGQIKQQFGLT